jgi:Xaa-Pro aminopeptidase
VFSVEPGIYLEGETGVRIEDLVVFDTSQSSVGRLTQFPREVVIAG